MKTYIFTPYEINKPAAQCEAEDLLDAELIFKQRGFDLDQGEIHVMDTVANNLHGL